MIRVFVKLFCNLSHTVKQGFTYLVSPQAANVGMSFSNDSVSGAW